MRVSISNIAWDKSDDENISFILKKHNIDAIDIAPGKYFADFSTTTNNDISIVRNWWAERGIEIIGMQSLLYGTKGLNIFDTPIVQQHMLNHLSDVCRIGNVLNAQRLVFGSPRNRDRSGLADGKAFDIAINFFKRLASIAQQHCVLICLEPNPECYGANFMTTTEETAEIVCGVNNPALKMQFDTGAIFMNGESPYDICSKFSHLIGHVHLSDPQLVPLGSSLHKHEESAAALKKYLPEVPVTIEMLTNSVEDVISTLESSIKFITACYGSTTML